MKHFVVISGCSGGGKSSLLAELSRRGHAVIAEPGRRIVAQEQTRGGRALPWIDPVAFAERAVDLALADFEAAGKLSGPVFFDRGLVDALAALEHTTGRPSLLRARKYRCHSRVFLAPPWPEIYVRDSERRHSLEDAVAEYERLRRVYASLDYVFDVLPKVGIAERAAIVLERLAADGL